MHYFRTIFYFKMIIRLIKIVLSVYVFSKKRQCKFNEKEGSYEFR